MKQNKNLIIFALVIIAIIAIALSLIIAIFYSKRTVINDFESCITAGNPAIETYPRQCRAYGQTYTEDTPKQRKYVSRDAEECKLVRFQCVAGSTPFSDETGCGCEGIFEEQNDYAELFREKAIEKSEAIPIEGFDPELYKGVFPGLISSDFNNTEAIGGTWIIVYNKLTFIRNNSSEITSADGTLTDKGINQLIDNVKSRLNAEVNSEADLDNLITLISEAAKQNYCSEESRNAEACIKIYDPVCGWSDPEKIQCIRYPCAQTYGNSCEACQNKDVLYWTQGKCPNEPPANGESFNIVVPGAEIDDETVLK